MDMERYGDYNEYEDYQYKKKSKAGFVIKLLIGFVCLFVVGILLFRVILFNIYPSAISEITYTNKLRNYYRLNGSIYAETQDLRTPYDDPNEGNFFCDNLILVRDAGHLQVSLRYNVSIYETIAAKYGVKLDAESLHNFSVRLVRDPSDNSKEGVEYEPIGALSLAYTDEMLMYKYHKLVFDGIDFDGVEWICLEVYARGVEKEPYRILIYENHVGFGEFKEYKIGEVPKK